MEEKEGQARKEGTTSKRNEKNRMTNENQPNSGKIKPRTLCRLTSSSSIIIISTLPPMGFCAEEGERKRRKRKRWWKTEGMAVLTRGWKLQSVHSRREPQRETERQRDRQTERQTNKQNKTKQTREENQRTVPWHHHKDAGWKPQSPFLHKLQLLHSFYSMNASRSSPAIKFPHLSLSFVLSPGLTAPASNAPLHKRRMVRRAPLSALWRTWENQSFMFFFRCRQCAQSTKIDSIDGLRHKPRDDEIIEICLGRNISRNEEGPSENTRWADLCTVLLDIDQLRPGLWSEPMTCLSLSAISLGPCARALMEAARTTRRAARAKKMSTKGISKRLKNRVLLCSINSDWFKKISLWKPSVFSFIDNCFLSEAFLCFALAAERNE